MTIPLRAATPVFVLLALLLTGCNDSGDAGAQGIQGIQGDRGPQGLQGSTGAQGVVGAQGLVGAQGVPGPQGVTGAQGTSGIQGLPGPGGSVGTAYVIPGSGGISGGGYLSLLTPDSNAELDITCNYGAVGEHHAFWFAGLGVSAGQVAITNQVEGQALQAFNDLQYNQGGQDFAVITGWPWHGVFTANESGTLTRWDVTMTGSAGQDCTVVVFANNPGPAVIIHP